MDAGVEGRGPVLRAGQEKRICFASVFTMTQLAVQEQLRSRNFFVEVTHSQAGTLTHLGPPYQLHEPWWQMRRPAPLLGEHNQEVLGPAFPLPSPQTQSSVLSPQSSKNRLPLDGVR